jgi:RNA polymerase sigma factor (sigma-70 family)
MRDAEVVTSIVAGDADGLGAAYDRYAEPLFKYCRILLGDPAGAADAVADTVIIAAARAGRLRQPEKLRSWLYAVARNECTRALRSRTGTAALDEAPDVTDDGADVTGQPDLRTLFEDATGGLNPGEREVVDLQLRHGMHAAQVATILGVSRGHAHTMLSRAREQLETCLGVLLVGRAGRDECAELGALLGDWDGRLSVPLRKRLQRHIERCSTCSARRAFELRPAMLLDLTPGAAMGAGAAESFRLAAGPAAGLKEHTLALATGQGPSAVAYRTAVLSRAGTFGKNGFPRLVRAGGKAVGAGRGGGAKARLRSSPRARAAVAAAVVLAVFVAGAGFVLRGNSAQLKTAAAAKPPVSAAGLGAATSSYATATTGRLSPSASSFSTSPAGPSPSAQGTAATVLPTSGPAPGGSTSAPAPPSSSAPPASSGTPSSGPGTPGTSPNPTSSPKPPPSSPAPSPSPGTLTVSGPGGPHGGTLVVVPGGAGGTLTLSASGGPVTWSASVANDPDGSIDVSPSSGTLTPSSPTTTVTVTASQAVPCGQGAHATCPTVTISPGGTTYVISTGSKSHDQAFSRQGTTAAPRSALFLNAVGRRRGNARLAD